MNGLRILEKEEIIDVVEVLPEWLDKFATVNVKAMFIIVTLFLAFIIGLLIFSPKKLKNKIVKNIGKGFVVYLVCIFALGIFCKVKSTTELVHTGRYMYTVIIEDDVSFNYIYENFNLISNENNVWVLEDK